MMRRTSSRVWIQATARLAAVCALTCACSTEIAFARSPSQPQQAPAPIERRTPGTHAAEGGAVPAHPGTVPHRLPRGEHLADWMNQHSTLTPEQQHQALAREPGFTDLPQQTQQRMQDRLAQLDAMNPQQRQRLLARNEAMERLAPDQRAQVRGAMSQLGGLPLDQRQAVARTFHALRELPPEQRISAFASGRYGAPLNDAQRGVLFNLLRVEPMLEPMLPKSQRSALPPR